MSPDETFDDPPDEGYTRLRMNIQRGDGPDQRGDVTVEIVRPNGDHGGDRSRSDSDDTADDDADADETVDIGAWGAPEMEAPENVDTRINDAAFAEMVVQTERAELLLKDRLGLSRG